MARRLLFLATVIFLFKATEGRGNMSTSDIKNFNQGSQRTALEAQKLAVSGERERAEKLLLEAISKEKKTAEKKKLIKSLNETSDLFYTEKSQKLYEYAKSIFRETPSEALKKLDEAEKLEPSNIKILIEKGWLLVLEGKCDQAQSLAETRIKQNPYYPELQLFYAQVSLCLQKMNLFESGEKFEELKKENYLAYLVTMAQWLFLRREYNQGLAKINEAEDLDAGYPEIYYWKYEILRRQSLDFKEPLLKYLRICKSISSSDYEKYIFEPRMCREAGTLEQEYKSLLQKDNEKDENN